eukprot:10800099-Alexandrium_andersonii.AAC.1
MASRCACTFSAEGSVLAARPRLFPCLPHLARRIAEQWRCMQSGCPDRAWMCALGMAPSFSRGGMR